MNMYDKKSRQQRRFKNSLTYRVNQVVQKSNVDHPIECDPDKSRGLTSYAINIKHELRDIAAIQIQDRRIRLREVLYADFVDEIEELRQVGMGYMNTQPYEP